jgi:hypothetical protein
VRPEDLAGFEIHREKGITRRRRWIAVVVARRNVLRVAGLIRRGTSEAGIVFAGWNRVFERFCPKPFHTGCETWTRPWTVSLPYKQQPQYGMYEYACHEGNYGMRNILSGARAEESESALQKLTVMLSRTKRGCTIVVGCIHPCGFSAVGA